MKASLKLMAIFGEIAGNDEVSRRFAGKLEIIILDLKFR